MKKMLIIICTLFLVCGCGTSHLEDGKESVVKFDEGGLSAEELYNTLKNKYGANELVTLIDTELLGRKYKETNEEKNYITSMITSMKQEYGENFETTIKNYYNVNSEDELKEIIRLTYRRNLWMEEFSKKEVNDTQINDYYESSLVGDIEASHILIEPKVSANASSDEKKKAEEEALEKAKNIITRLNNGESFDDLAKELSDDASNKNDGGKLGKFNDRTNFDENFLDAAIKLEVGKYSSTPVKSQFGYHIIYKTSQAEKPKLEDVKDDVISKVAESLRKADGYLAKSLLGLREEYGIKITDSELENAYNKLYGL